MCVCVGGGGGGEGGSKRETEREAVKQTRSKHIIGSKEHYLLGKKQAIWGGSPLHQATKQHFNNS